MRIAVIGGAGFTGSHLVSALLALKNDVLVYDNCFTRAGRSELPWLGRVDAVEADITDGRRLCRELVRFAPDVLCHLAALHYIPYCDRHPAETLRVNVEGTLNVMLAAAELRQVKAVLFASSVAVYAPTDAYHAETNLPAPCDIYGLSKWLAEQIVEQYARQMKVSHLSLRFSNLYGPGETNPHVIPAVLGQLLEGAEVLHLGRTDPYRDFLYVGDLVEAMLMAVPYAMRQENHQVLNLGSGSEWTVQEAVDTLCKLSGRRVQTVRDESRVRAVDRTHLRADITRARELLGWAPRHDLRTGLAKTFAEEQARRPLRMAAAQV
jgi:UDP-glucose 4-epimerase